MSGGTWNRCSLWHGGWKGAAVPSGDARNRFLLRYPSHFEALHSNSFRPLERATAVFALVSTGELKLRIERSYSLADAEQAHRDFEWSEDDRQTAPASVEDPICTQIREHQRLIFTVSEMWTSPLCMRFTYWSSEVGLVFTDPVEPPRCAKISPDSAHPASRSTCQRSHAIPSYWGKCWNVPVAVVRLLWQYESRAPRTSVRSKPKTGWI
jgi:hypothetical protein